MSQFGGKREPGLTCCIKPEETALPVCIAATSKAATRGIQTVTPTLRSNLRALRPSVTQPVQQIWQLDRDQTLATCTPNTSHRFHASKLHSKSMGNAKWRFIARILLGVTLKCCHGERLAENAFKKRKMLANKSELLPVDADAPCSLFPPSTMVPTLSVTAFYLRACEACSFSFW